MPPSFLGVATPMTRYYQHLTEKNWAKKFITFPPTVVKGRENEILPVSSLFSRLKTIYGDDRHVTMSVQIIFTLGCGYTYTAHDAITWVICMGQKDLKSSLNTRAGLLGIGASNNFTQQLKGILYSWESQLEGYNYIRECIETHYYECNKLILAYISCLPLVLIFSHLCSHLHIH